MAPLLRRPFSTLALTAAAGVAPFTTFAQENAPAFKGLTAVGDKTALASRWTVGSIAIGLIKQALGLLGIILAILVIYSGYLWMTAQGNEEQVTKAKKMITNAVIGMILAFSAYAITDFVIKAITGPKA